MTQLADPNEPNDKTTRRNQILAGNDIWTQVTSSVGWGGAVHMMITLSCIALAWWALQNVKFEMFIRHPQSPQGKMVHLILAILAGRTIAQFFVNYWGWAESLRFLF